MKKFTIIGANSNLARNFICFLEDKNVELKLYDVQDCHFDGREGYSRINFLDMDEVKKIDFDCDAAFVFSGVTGAERSVKETNLFIDVNEKVLVNILNAVKECGSKCRLVYPSSRLVYKDGVGAHKETDPLEGKSVYALNKIFAEKYIEIFSATFGLEYTIFRIAIPFGELNSSAQKYGIVSKLLEQGEKGKITLFGDGGGVRTFTHIRNICEALYYGCDKEETSNGIFNIGGCAYTFLELAKLISEKTGGKIDFIEWPENAYKVEVLNGNLDSSRLDSILDIKYVDIKETLF